MLILESDFLKANPFEFTGKVLGIHLSAAKPGGFFICMYSIKGAGPPQVSHAGDLGVALEALAVSAASFFNHPGSTADHLHDAGEMLLKVGAYVPLWVAMLEANQLASTGGTVH
jgi:hypothetical protein